MKSTFVTSMTRTFSRAGLKLKKHSPEILLTAGVIGTVASTVMACKATLEANELLKEAKKTLDAIDKVAENPDNAEKYSEEDHKKAVGIVYAKTGLELTKIYGPALAVGVTSLACIIGSHTILNRRNVALAGTLTAVTRNFNEYRSRLIDRFGKELDRELRYNIKAEEVEAVSVDENGNEVVTKEIVNVADPTQYSPYAIVFDDGNAGWDKDPERTKFFLIQQQNWANELLRSRGHLFLNEVYDMLGAKRTKAGAQVGWIYDEKAEGDTFVDFGIFDIYNPKARDFVNGYERVIVLDFNVLGPILDLI